jgi:hypothetical protein
VDPFKIPQTGFSLQTGIADYAPTRGIRNSGLFPEGCFEVLNRIGGDWLNPCHILLIAAPAPNCGHNVLTNFARAYSSREPIAAIDRDKA